MNQRQHARRRDLLEQARREREIALELERSALNQMEDDVRGWHCVWEALIKFFARFHLLVSHYVHTSIPII